MKLYCASGNPGKLREFRLAAERFGIEIAPLPGLDRIPACPETGRTFEENAIRKAEWYGAYAAGPLFADDSGLEVDALNGAPGVHSARFAGEGASDADNNRLLLEKLRGVDNRGARFVCVAALVESGKPVRTFRAAVEGQILTEARGSRGFGYDPVFYYPPFGCSFGEVPEERKLEVSHRGKALAALFTELASAPAERGRHDKLQGGDSPSPR